MKNKHVKSFEELNKNKKNVNYNKINENRDIKYNELVREIKYVCERYSIYLDPSDIIDALDTVSNTYAEYL